MISNEIWILAGTAVALGCFHTLVGPRPLPALHRHGQGAPLAFEKNPG